MFVLSLLLKCANTHWKRLQDIITDKTQVYVQATETKRSTQHIAFLLATVNGKPIARHSEGDVDYRVRFRRCCAL
jgi:hypothetical protein